MLKKGNKLNNLSNKKKMIMSFVGRWGSLAIGIAILNSFSGLGSIIGYVICWVIQHRLDKKYMEDKNNFIDDIVNEFFLENKDKIDLDKEKKNICTLKGINKVFMVITLIWLILVVVSFLSLSNLSGFLYLFFISVTGLDFINQYLNVSEEVISGVIERKIEYDEFNKNFEKEKLKGLGKDESIDMSVFKYDFSKKRTNLDVIRDNIDDLKALRESLKEYGKVEKFKDRSKGKTRELKK